MAYQTAKTIKSVIDNIKKRHYVLPSIQREFVWGPSQIERLFDSLMRGYPISTFLLWRVEKENINDFQFYEFIKHYHEKDNKHNSQVDLPNDQEVEAILDGQQRMTSLFIGLTGSYAKKRPYYKWDSPHAFPRKKLYLNLLKQSEDIELEYDFKFLTDAEVENSSDNFWFEVGKVLEFTDLSKVMEYMMENGLSDTSKYDQSKTTFALRTLNELFNVVHQKGIVSYYLEESKELDKVLQIFIRINSGGTKLSYSDLLLSIATAKWADKDAREVIHHYVDDINTIGDGFDFNKDFVLKSCLVLSDLKDIKFKVDNFTRKNMSLIESKWDGIAEAIRASIKLVAHFGFNRDNLSSSNALIPIAYFIYKNRFEDSILHTVRQVENRDKIKQWLARVLLKGTFGGTPDAIYPVMRNLVNSNLGEFPLEQTIEYYKGRRKSISFSEDDIDNVLEYQYGKSRTFSALSLLYSGLNYNYKYHQDHIHPKKYFTSKKLLKQGVNVAKVEDYLDRFNKLSNLQLLQANENKEKSATMLKPWLKNTHTSEERQNAFFSQNYIGKDDSLDFDDFISFYENRKLRLKQKLAEILNVELKSVEKES